jgi:hypothetical protein
MYLVQEAFMVLSILTEVFPNNLGKPILHIKRAEKYYFVDDKNMSIVSFFENLLLNSISFAIVIGWIAKLKYLQWGLISIVLYIGFTIFFNAKILPKLSVVSDKKAQKKQKTEFSKGRAILVILASFVIALGLVASLVYEPLHSSTVDDKVVMAGALIAAFIGLKYASYYIKNR